MIGRVVLFSLTSLCVCLIVTGGLVGVMSRFGMIDSPVNEVINLQGLSTVETLLFGGILNTTDPIAILSTFRDINIPD